MVIQTNGITVRADGRVTLRPPEDGNGLCNQPDETIGLCVIPADVDLDTGEFTERVSDVTIMGFRVVGFDGSGEAGLYVGDSPHADALVTMNRTRNNLFGVLVRHTHDVSVVRNMVSKNCLGVFLLDDRQ